MAYKFELYRVEKLSDVIGNSAAVSAVKAYAMDISRGVKKKPIMLFGPSGTGKTSTAYALAHEMGWNLVELNASDYRDSASILTKLMPAAMSRSLFGKMNMILLDEIDELVARFDSGANKAIIDLIESARCPVVFTANDFWDKKISFLRTRVEPVAYRRVASFSAAALVERVAKANAIKIDGDAVKAIVVRSNGDMRSAMNDLAVIEGAGDMYDDIVYNALGMRDRKSDIFSVLDKVFYSNTVSAALRAIADSDVDNDMLMKWIDENIPKRYKDRRDLHEAFMNLALASIFYTRAFRSQNYGYWRYMNVMMSAGVALSKTQYPSKAERYSFPKAISSLSATKELRGSNKVVAIKLKRIIHSNSKDIVSTYLPLIREIIKSALKLAADKGDVYDALESGYGLDKKDVDAILKG
ncbi:AAA ATPase central domain protein [mine drainage metagenome]|uniref:AAA ATPase central domain protein n=2 Tax=mine drainage metagenome TaxID=410659 RepID=T0ZL43_9ZZZZ